MERKPDNAGSGSGAGAGAGDPLPPPFLEVTCRSSGKVRRFAFGTTARYALHAVNRKLAPGDPAALHVEAVKDGEEPVSFGPAAPLADYGDGWKLQTITEQDAPGYYQTPAFDTRRDETKQPVKNSLDKETMAAYITKIVLAFVFIFLLGGLFTYLLETVPDMFQPASEPEPL
ncbi:hypothetical protein E2562_034066 [Oryza meyeriana var. granulata]|uniref:Uncharacterized protein n=1 Tax=Oryza meyeriana var. granulata TaxID=110450 RepID=A0A6G1DRA1_9ORYZ|nr:hypothetical protein E2562_034066 [Oryza meyeriana var. granulata]